MFLWEEVETHYVRRKVRRIMSENKEKRRLPIKWSAFLLFAAMCLCLLAGCARLAPASEPDCDVLFYGDSITAGGNFDEYFPDLRVVNLGINGATLENLTEWVPKVSAHHPDKIFVMAGGNNLYAGNVEECTELFRGLLEALREACPYAEIFVESMLPLDKAIASKADCPNRVIRDFNGRLEALAAEYGMPYLDIYPAYLDRGGLNSALTEDGIHLKDDAFGPWAEIVRPYLEP